MVFSEIDLCLIAHVADPRREDDGARACIACGCGGADHRLPSSSDFSTATNTMGSKRPAHAEGALILSLEVQPVAYGRALPAALCTKFAVSRSRSRAGMFATILSCTSAAKSSGIWASTFSGASLARSRISVIALFRSVEPRRLLCRSH